MTHSNGSASFRFRIDGPHGYAVDESYEIFRGRSGKMFVETPLGYVPLGVFLQQRKAGLIIGRVLHQVPRISDLDRSMIEVTTARRPNGKRIIRVTGGELDGRQF
ncbi:MAG: hypothetical protein HY545_02355 [Candidatus Doudnabacteria bacterium]|nr:hypothetical protein [Candidatus Doudnabacteria bacterium]